MKVTQQALEMNQMEENEMSQIKGQSNTRDIKTSTKNYNKSRVTDDMTIHAMYFN